MPRLMFLAADAIPLKHPASTSKSLKRIAILRLSAVDGPRKNASLSNFKASFLKGLAEKLRF